MPFIVLIELVRSLIRPLTLSIRLVANIVAGHLLLTLLRSSITPCVGSVALGVTLGTLVGLSCLESAVAGIQAYVFRVLSTLYVREADSQPLSKAPNLTLISLTPCPWFCGTPTGPVIPEVEIVLAETPPLILIQPSPTPSATASDTLSTTATVGSTSREIEMRRGRRVESLHLDQGPRVATPDPVNEVFCNIYDFS